MTDIVIILVIVVLCVLGVRTYLKKLSKGCCGGSDGKSRVKVADKNQNHYPYSMILGVEGMTCSNCRQRVENALNSRDGIWAKANLEKKNVLVRMKEPVSREELRTIIERAGYQVTKGEE